MSAISDLAQSFEKRSETQAGAIEQTLANAYRKHEQSLLEQLRSSEQSLHDAIRAREKSLQTLLSSTEKRTRATVLSSWKWVVLSLFLVVASSGGRWWTGQKIASNVKLLNQHSTLWRGAPAWGWSSTKTPTASSSSCPRSEPQDRLDVRQRKRQAIKIER